VDMWAGVLSPPVRQAARYQPDNASDNLSAGIVCRRAAWLTSWPSCWLSVDMTSRSGR